MLTGKVAVVTGAARGIGRAVAELFVDNGAVVYAVDMRADLLQETVDDIAGKYRVETIFPIVFDVTNVNAQKEMFQAIWKNINSLISW